MQQQTTVTTGTNRMQNCVALARAALEGAARVSFPSANTTCLGVGPRSTLRTLPQPQQLLLLLPPVCQAAQALLSAVLSVGWCCVLAELRDCT